MLVHRSAIKLIAPAFSASAASLHAAVAWLRACNFSVSDIPTGDGSVAARGKELRESLLDKQWQILLSVRGGYGVSDILPLLPYKRLSRQTLVVGFSDISALLSALWTQNKIIGLHGAMPATNSWVNNKTQEMKTLVGLMSGDICEGNISLQPLVEEKRVLTGKLFGGCFSVLTNLIATPYFPASLAGHILFFEDVNESVWKLLRYLNNWLYSGRLTDVQAIILGRFEGLQGEVSHLHQEFAQRVSCPVYLTYCFGHSAPLYPLPVGADATISGESLFWQITKT